MTLAEAARRTRLATGSARQRLAGLGPAWLAFIGSLLLSTVAIYGSAGPNRDGMLYLDTARLFLDHGFAAAKANFDWPYLAIGIGLLSRLTGFGVETTGYALCALLLAGVCAVLVLITRRQFPDAAWAACLVVLALPAFNAYRDHLIREFGFWLFSLLALLLALRWSERLRWASAFAVLGAIAMACLFRLEAAMLLPALLLWQAFAVGGSERWRRLVMLGSVPAAALATAAVLVGSGAIGVDGRIEYYLSASDPLAMLERFGAAAERMAGAVLNKYSADEAGSILFFGLLSTVPAKFMDMSGVLLVPLLFAGRCLPPGTLLGRWQPLGWSFAVYAGVLVVFLMHQFFLTSRYVGFLAILAVPLIACGLACLLRRHRRWRVPVVAVIVFSALVGVMPPTSANNQYRQAGAWLAANVADRSRVYSGSPRTAYHAGWPYKESVDGMMSMDDLAAAVAAGRYDLAVLESGRGGAVSEEWLRSVGVVEIKRFTNAKDTAAVVVLARRR
ncbi:hypothetical protein MXC99_08635 [Thauera aromatica]|uniref:hypothetical protein n=1 Tax=Thauera aromatica TaxID=59405 RepID=UPI001FFD6C00|nr:hypothetical protein [Thauera aromatica]MCK2088237.1 hypothetical protein [Thauera aromatica]